MGLKILLLIDFSNLSIYLIYKKIQLIKKLWKHVYNIAGCRPFNSNIPNALVFLF